MNFDSGENRGELEKKVSDTDIFSEKIISDKKQSCNSSEKINLSEKYFENVGSENFSIEIKSTDKNIVLSYIFRYSAVFIISSLIGIIFLTLFGAQPEKININYVFENCVTVTDYINASVSYASGDMIYMLVILLSGFSVICAPVTSFIMMFRGFAFGYTAAYIYFGTVTKSSANSLLPMILMIAVYVLISILFIIFSSYNTEFSLTVRKEGISKKVISKNGIVPKHIKKFSVICGMVIILSIMSAAITRFI